jgi:hypothetical protein
MALEVNMCCLGVGEGGFSQEGKERRRKKGKNLGSDPSKMC